jgi:3-methylcrotonyl-CoA carboxylase alpha subunit
VERTHDGASFLVIDGQRHPFSSRWVDGQRYDITLGDRRMELSVYAAGNRIGVFGAEGSVVVDEFDPIAHAGDAAGEGGRLTAPMPGKVVAFLAQPGDVVSKGQPLAVMEAMKMEHTITAPRDGTVEELMYAVGDQVSEGGELLRLAAQ